MDNIGDTVMTGMECKNCGNANRGWVCSKICRDHSEWQPKTAPGKEWVNGVYESGGTSPIVLEEMPQITLINTRGN
jgi:hypothetical protein